MRRSALLLVLAGASAAGCSEPAAESVTRQVILDLATQDYGAASSRYRMYEAEVLSEEAAPLWRQALGHEDSTVREWAVDALSRIALPGDAERVTELLGDRSRGVRQQAKDGLIRMDPGHAAVEFGSRIGSADPEQVVLAAEGLAELDAEGAVEAILERVTDRGLPEVTRGALTQPLATLGDPVAAETLADIAADPSHSAQLRRLAAEALVTLDGPEVRRAIERLLGSDDAYVATLAQTALEPDRAP